MCIVMIDALRSLLWLTRPLMQRVEAQVEHGLTGTELTVRMRAVLEILHHHGPLPVPDLARLLEIQRQYVQVMVNDTIKAHLTEKSPNPRHTRSPLIRLTPKGTDCIRMILEREAEILDLVSDGLSPDEVAIALRVLRHCHAKLEKQI
ncbi:DNA-binding transcriptional regulator, MarR family [Aliiroseovarius crassostreae]|nr:MarR family transcriptional regulator [Aliiroseovarius crassostreae]SFU73454.1 DNA-binding transcriptional regulator, MarR family [Aliiroseovarius crassostreae]